MNIYNFSHPLSRAALDQIKAIHSDNIIEVQMRFQMDMSRPLIEQVTLPTLLTPFMVVLPAMSAGAALVLRAIVDQTGRWPRIIVMRRDESAPFFTTFTVKEIIDLNSESTEWSDEG